MWPFGWALFFIDRVKADCVGYGAGDDESFADVCEEWRAWSWKRHFFVSEA